MSDASDEDAIHRRVGDLVSTLQRLERELGMPSAGRGLRPPTPRELARFTSEVTIPALVLGLRVNIEALRLLQRTLRLADSRGQKGDRDRATGSPQEVTRAVLDRLDGVFADLEEAVAARPPDDEVRTLLEQARSLQADVDAALAASGEGEGADPAVPVDVDAELDAIRRDLDAGAEGGDDSPGDSGGEPDGTSSADGPS